MRVLAIDTALGATAVALYDSASGTVLAQEATDMAKGHAEALMPMIARVAGDQCPAAERIAVTVGPGSFTGIRIGLAAAKGLGLAWGVPVIGISTLSAYAAPALWGPGSDRRPVAVAVDARHGQFYFAFFTPDGRPLAGPAVFTTDEAVRKTGDGAIVAVGDGAEAFAIAKASASGRQLPRIDQRASPEIEWVARLGAAADPVLAPARPLYLREANAAPPAGGLIRRS